MLGICGAYARQSGERAREGQLMLADPFILEDDGWFYIYGTHADDGIVEEAKARIRKMK